MKDTDLLFLWAQGAARGQPPTPAKAVTIRGHRMFFWRTAGGPMPCGTFGCPVICRHPYREKETGERRR